MEFFILIAAVLIIVGFANALANRTPDHPRRRARALNVARPAPVASTGTHTDTSDSLATFAIASYGTTADYQPLDDHTRNTDSSASWNSGANDCAPADSGSWGSGGDSGGSMDSGGCDSGSSD